MDTDDPTPPPRRAHPYELYAVLVHQGSASFGHYYALLQDVDKGEWFEFNDATVKPIKPSELRRAVGGAESSGSRGGGLGWSGGTSAYMLLYREVADGARAAAALAAASGTLTAAPTDRFPSTGGRTLGGGGAGSACGNSGPGAGQPVAADGCAGAPAGDAKRLRLSAAGEAGEGNATTGEDNPYTRMGF